MKKIKTAQELALRDIAKYISENNIIKIKNKDVWNILPSHLNTKKIRKLNRDLGLRNLNYTKKAMSRKPN